MSNSGPPAPGEPAGAAVDVLVLTLPPRPGVTGAPSVEVAIPAHAVREVVRGGRLTALPGSPADVPGVVAASGGVYTLLSLAGAGGEVAADELTRWLVIVGDANRALALGGARPLRVVRARVAAAEVSDSTAGVRVPATGRVLPVGGAVRLDADPRGAAAPPALPLLDVAALLGDLFDDTHGV